MPQVQILSPRLHNEFISTLLMLWANDIHIFAHNIHSYRGVTQFGRVLGLGPRCRRFESCHLDFTQKHLPSHSLSVQMNDTFICTNHTHTQSGHRVSRRYETGLTPVTDEFDSRWCTIPNLHYMGIHGRK